MVSQSRAKEIMGSNFIGVEELASIASKINLSAKALKEDLIPNISYSEGELQQYKATHILILAVPFTANGAILTLMELRKFFGLNPDEKEPCFYNQDWYVKEDFIKKGFENYHWVLIRKELIDESRAKEVNTETGLNSLPSALICAYTFFAYYYHSNEYLWKNDFVWCSDTDANGDRIYVGRYLDPAGIAKNGFSIHRHLRLRNNYGCIESI
ncbi:MAG: hypothetical protein JSS98_06520 [Bacteroidetes bacterium]|nr:hypothetical protein [Bacteroidota bacterium]